MAPPRRSRSVPVRIVRWLGWIVFGVVGLWVVVMALYAQLVPPVSTLMLSRWVTGQPIDRRWIPLEAISPNLQASVITSEDARFCEHEGVDWEALHQVMDNADEDGPSRGASTIAMQTAKNLFLWPSRSYVRKALEIPLALAIDAVWSKRRILEIYLNIAEWGPGIFGAEAAAQASFGKSAAKLSPREAALLATALPNPLLRNPGKPGRGHVRLATRIEARSADAGPYLACLAIGRPVASAP